MRFYEKFIELCRERNSSPAAVAKEIGLSNSATTAWKRGAKPKRETLEKISNYFNIPISELLNISQLPDKKTKLNEYSNKFVILNTNEQELEAFHEYLNNMGYEAKIDLKRFDLNVSEASNETVTANPDLKVWIINDHRKNKKYAVSTNDMNTLLKSVNDYTLFQVAKLLETAEEID